LCDDGKLPVQPTPSLPFATTASEQASQEFSLSGSVADTVARPLAGATVEIFNGSRSGTATTTNEHGRFWLPGTFTGTVTMKASKDGYIAEYSTAPPSFPPVRTPGGAVRMLRVLSAIQARTSSRWSGVDSTRPS
jgi:hypothetical protein